MTATTHEPTAEHETGELVGRIVTRLGDLGWTVATAESCTGGLIGARITDVPGSSRVYVGGVVAYSNATKRALLAVPDEVIARHGAVSEPVARRMAEGIAQTLRTDVGLAATGIAGPGGGTPDKPVGTVWMAVASPRGTSAWHRVFSGDRAAVRSAATRSVLRAVVRLVDDGRS